MYDLLDAHFLAVIIVVASIMVTPFYPLVPYAIFLHTLALLNDWTFERRNAPGTRNQERCPT